jgi:hypothetical protein
MLILKEFVVDCFVYFRVKSSFYCDLSVRFPALFKMRVAHFKKVFSLRRCLIGDAQICHLLPEFTFVISD